MIESSPKIDFEIGFKNCTQKIYSRNKDWVSSKESFRFSELNKDLLIL